MLYSRNLDKSVPIPLYFQLKNILLEEMSTGNYPIGSMIPTEKELSKIFAISRTTVRQAITELVQEGKLYRFKSKGTFVARPKISHDFITRLQTFNEEILQAGRIPSTELLAFEVVTMPEDCVYHLHAEAGSKAIFLHRKRYADGIPVVVVETYLQYDVCKFILDHDFSKESLYNVLSQNEKTKIFRVSRVVEAVAADSRDAAILEIKRGKPVHFFLTTGFNHDNQPIEYSKARYRGDQSTFHVDIYIETGR